ncbi:hypothetical protein E2C01_037466 [Portunus trituberculatus]|uniref:Uncharacterized protein n=1 Tax=Portunus trituberculatus TaxID=210409 RepID=A0A5B7FBH5_PORTR|nr:hypothetical protein [Portunus trituberculatus]
MALGQCHGLLREGHTGLFASDNLEILNYCALIGSFPVTLVVATEKLSGGPVGGSRSVVSATGESAAHSNKACGRSGVPASGMTSPAGRLGRDAKRPPARLVVAGGAVVVGCERRDLREAALFPP